MRKTILGLAAVAGFACTATNRDPISLPLGDEVVFAAEVQPYVGLACGSLDCHGDGGRALQLFAVYGLREAADLRTLDIADTEVTANVASVAALSDSEPSQHIALLKALATSAGGLAHVGGDIWPDADAPGYQCLLAYLEGQSNSNACAQALSEVEIEP